MIDSSLWVDYFRPKTPLAIRRQVISQIDRADAVLCDPVRFEILRAARPTERKPVLEAFATLPFLATPPDLWQNGIELGQKCAEAGVVPFALDLLIATVCLHHDVPLVTFDADFSRITKVCPLKVHLLVRGAGTP